MVHSRQVKSNKFQHLAPLKNLQVNKIYFITYCYTIIAPNTYHVPWNKTTWSISAINCFIASLNLCQKQGAARQGFDKDLLLIIAEVLDLKVKTNPKTNFVQ